MKDIDRDFLAVQEDALLVDFVAAREDLSAFADDHVAQLLGAYAADVDEGLELLANAELPEAAASLTPARSGFSPRRSTRFLVAATTAVVLVGTSGVAAAVTGDPLSPFRSVVKVVTGGGHTPAADPGREGNDLPDPAATEAEVALSLNAVKQALKDGDVEKAQRLLDDVRTDVNGDAELAPGLDARLDKLQDEVDNAAQGQGQGQGQDQGQGQNGANPGQGDPQDDKAKHDNNANSPHPDNPGQGDEKPNKPGKDNAASGEGNAPGPADSDGSKQGSGKGKGDRSGKQHSTGAGGQTPGNQSGGGGQVKGRPDRGPDKADKGPRADKGEVADTPSRPHHPAHPDKGGKAQQES
jgi:hypothetical protein